MQAIRIIPLPPPPPPPPLATQPAFVSPYYAHLNARSHMKRPQHLGGGADPDALDRLLVNGNDMIRNAPPVQCSLEHITIQNMNAACTSADLTLLKMLIDEWRISLDPNPGPPGYEIYALEPVFYHAIRQSQSGILEYFFNHGIQLCRLAIQEAIVCGSSSAVFQIFIDRGWDINDNPPGRGMRCFPYSPLCQVLQQGNNEELVRWFLDHGADPNGNVQGKGVTNFMWATCYNSFSIIQLMHKFGARPIGGILTFAIRRQDDCWRVVKFLLDNGAAIDDPELEHDTLAAFGGFYQGSAIGIASTELCEDEVVELLLSRGARTNIQNFEGDTCLEIAKKYGSKRKVELIESYNAQLARQGDRGVTEV